jgi:DNA-3-methyladenine glycosylase II
MRPHRGSSDNDATHPVGESARSDRWAAGRDALRAADPVLARLVDADPGLDPDARFARLAVGDPWAALVFGVVGQQLSVIAARAIMGRLQERFGDGAMPPPARLAAADPDELRAVGLSRAKSASLVDLGTRVQDGRLDLDGLEALDDDAARAALTEVKGVGRFTAEGVLMLALRRPDVLPAGDLALRRAVQRVFRLPVAPTIAEVDERGEAWRPWRTLAAAYLYDSLG